jgi:hypothetical protein
VIVIQFLASHYIPTIVVVRRLTAALLEEDADIVNVKRKVDHPNIWGTPLD